MSENMFLIPRPEAEEAVVGAVLINPDAYLEVAEFLQADDFHLHRFRYVWESFGRLFEQRIPIDFVTVTEDLEKHGRLVEIGGPAALAELLSVVPTSLHAQAYGRLVEEASLRRRVLRAANEIAQIACQEELSVEQMLDEAEKAIFTVSERRLTRELYPVSQVIGTVYQELEKKSRGEQGLGLPTGFPDLDALLQGWQPSDLVIVAGRPGMGKTGFLLSIARHAASVHKKHVGIFSLEMSKEQLVQRLLAQEAGVDSQKLRHGRLTEAEWQRVTEATAAMGTWKLFLDDTPAVTPTQLRTRMRKLHLEFGLDLVLVDYLQLMSGGRKVENRTQEVSLISRQLKVMARELDVPLLTAAQLSRAVEQRADKRPLLSDLRESGSLEQDSDVVMFLFRPEVYDKDPTGQGKAEVIVAKHRHGPVGVVPLTFQAEYARFVSQHLQGGRR